MIDNIPNILKHIYDEIKNFTDIAIVHLNGDLKSVVLATILKESLGKENVYCLFLPYGNEINEINSTNELVNTDPSKIAKHLGVNFSKKYCYSLIQETNDNLIQLFSSIDILKNSEINLVSLKNSEVRSRMSLIYGLRYQLSFVTNKKTRVIGSVSLSEDFINSNPDEEEVFSDLLPLAELFESELEQLADYFIEKNILSSDLVIKKESFSVYENNLSKKLLKINYGELEKSIRKIASENWSDTEWSDIDELVWEKHVRNKNKIHLVKKLGLREKFCDDFGFKSDRNYNRSLR
jgi:hypothetical protein